MPNKSAAKKSLRQMKRRMTLNQTYKEKFRDGIKKAARATSFEEAKKLVIVAQKALDKAAKHGTIKKNTAARKLSRLMKKINKLGKNN